METEADTLRYVREQFGIPAPEIIYDWLDEDCRWSFLILKPVESETLRQAWPSPSDHQRKTAASQVAEYCEILAEATSDSLASATGHGMRDQYLSPDRPLNAPSWKPILFPPLPLPQAKMYLCPLDAGENFHFYHADLGPTNVMVSRDGRVTGILDWESAAFYPRVWIGTKPRVSYGFILEGVDGDKWAWSKLLSEALEERKFVPYVQGFSAFQHKTRLPMRRT